MHLTEERTLLRCCAGDWLASLRPAPHLLAFGGLGKPLTPDTKNKSSLGLTQKGRSEGA